MESRLERRNPGMEATELAELLTRVKAGHADAWGELYRCYGPAIFRFCRRALPAKEDAEDATNEIFMKVRQKLGTYDASRPFQAWLYKVASNHCWDMLRRRRIRQDLESGEEVESLPLKSPDPDQLQRLQTEHTNQELRAGLQKLPDRARMALVLRYFGDMSYEEIAETLAVRPTFVGVLLLRARHQLRQVLQEGDTGLARGTAGGKA